MSHGRASIVLFVLLALLAPAAAQEKAEKRKREKEDAPASMHESSEARQVLDKARGQVANKEWAQALESVRELLDKHSDKLLDGERGTLLTTGQAARRFLAKLPAAGIEELSKQHQEDLARRLAVARSEGPAALEAFANHFFPLAEGAEALLLAGELSFEEGSTIAAFMAFREVLEHHPLAAARSRAARRLVATVGAFDDAGVAVGLERLIRHADLPDQQALIEAARAEGARVEENADLESIEVSVSASGEVGRVRDAVPPADGPEVRFNLPNCPREFNPLRNAPEVNPNVFPVPPPIGARWLLTGSRIVTRRDEDDEPADLLLVHLGRAVVAYDASPTSEGDRVWSFPGLAGVENHLASLPRAQLIARYGLTVSRGVVYATLHTDLDDQKRGRGGRNDASMPGGTLVAIDLDRGKKVFELEPDSGEKLSFFGTPLVRAGVVYCGASTAGTPSETFAVAVGRSGELLWKRALTASEGIAAQNNGWGAMCVRTLPAPSFSYAHGAVVVCSQNGLLAALDARDGRTLWARPYRHEEPPNQNMVFQTRGRDNQRLLARGQSPPLPVNGHAFVLPTDSTHASWFRLGDGHEVKSYARRRGENRDAEWSHVLGIAGGKIVLNYEGYVGAYRLHASLPPDWEWDGNTPYARSSRGRSIGRPILGRTRVYLSYARGESDEKNGPMKRWKGGLYAFDLESGRCSLEYAWSDPKHPEAGDLLIARGRFFVVGFGRAWAFARTEEVPEEEGSK